MRVPQMDPLARSMSRICELCARPIGHPNCLLRHLYILGTNTIIRTIRVRFVKCTSWVTIPHHLQSTYTFHEWVPVRVFATYLVHRNSAVPSLTQYILTDNATLTSRHCRWFRQLAACELHAIQAIGHRTIRTQTRSYQVIHGVGEHCSVIR